MDRPVIDATDTAVDQGTYAVPPTLKSRLEPTARTPRTDAMQRPWRQEECLISFPNPVPSISSQLGHFLLATRISLHHTHAA